MKAALDTHTQAASAAKEDGMSTRTHTQMRTEIVVVTPEMAAELLTHNATNRPPTQARVRYFMREQRGGTATLTHQGLAIDTNGDLQDGQHRLLSIVETGIPWELSITYGVPPANFSVIDRGGSRSLADLMAIRGYRDKNSIAVATVAWQWERGQVSFRRTPRDVELAEFLDRWPLMADVTRIRKSELAPPRQMSFVNVMAVDEDFMSDLLDDEADGTRPGAALAQLWRQRRKAKQHVDPKLELAQFVKARNDHARGEQPDRRYGLRQAEAFPVPEWNCPVPFNTRPVDEDDEV